LPFLLSVVEERDAGRQGRERALRQALASIADVADPIRREYLLQEAAELFGIGVNVLREHLTGRKSTRRGRVSPKSETVDQREEATTEAPKPQGRGVRSFRAVDAAEIESVLFAHLLRDVSGQAAREFLAQRGDLSLSTPVAERLAGELQAWQDDSGPHGRDPAAFIQRHWHGEGDESYRAFVTDVLAKEGIPDQTDFARVIKESLQRLRSGRDLGH
jgi:hypothetical protein